MPHRAFLSSCLRLAFSVSQLPFGNSSFEDISHFVALFFYLFSLLPWEGGPFFFSLSGAQKHPKSVAAAQKRAAQGSLRSDSTFMGQKKRLFLALDLLKVFSMSGRCVIRARLSGLGYLTLSAMLHCNFSIFMSHWAFPKASGLMLRILSLSWHQHDCHR